jgi:hypothetical protein
MERPANSDGAEDRSAPQWFATTHWSVVLAARQGDVTEARDPPMLPAGS